MLKWKTTPEMENITNAKQYNTIQARLKPEIHVIFRGTSILSFCFNSASHPPTPKKKKINAKWGYNSFTLL